MVYLVGNKLDLSDRREVSYEEGADFANSYGIKFMEVSTKANTNFEELFDMLTKAVLEKGVGDGRLVDTDGSFSKPNVNKALVKKKGGCLCFRQNTK